MLAACDRHERIVRREAARGVLAGQQSRNDAVLRADARGEDAADVGGAAAPGPPARDGVKFVGPDLLSADAIQQARADDQLAVRIGAGLACAAMQLEARGSAQRLVAETRVT